MKTVTMKFHEPDDGDVLFVLKVNTQEYIDLMRFALGGFSDPGSSEWLKGIKSAITCMKSGYHGADTLTMSLELE